MAIKFLRGSLVQGANDAFVTSVIENPFAGLERDAFRLRSIEIEWPGATAVNGCDWEFALGRVAMAAAVPALSALGVMYRQKRRLTVAGAAGMIYVTHVDRIVFPEDDEILAVESSLHVAFDSSATALTNTLFYRIGYDSKRISETEKLNLRLDALAS